ncbi:MAG: hypothetical protein OXR62_10920 [Ahrensia sp.]|nr:hypothetical protein [Ahrensia sp.]
MDADLNHTIQPLTHAESGTAPEWIQLTPAAHFSGADGRGPYDASQAQSIIDASLQSVGKIAIDENHATDLLASKGGPAPARGWIVELAARGDSIWGRVEWTKAGEKLVADREYGFVSPVFSLVKSKAGGVVKRILRASIVNDPNLTLKSLHSRSTKMDEELAEALGLDKSAQTQQAVEAVKSLNGKVTQLQADVAAVHDAAKTDKDAGVEEALKALQSQQMPAVQDDEETEQLRETVKTLNSQLQSLAQSTAREKATAVIEAALQAQKIQPVLREHYIDRHMADPDSVEKELDAMVSLNFGGIGKRPPETSGSLSGSDEQVCEMMGLDPKAFAETSKHLNGAS